MAADFYGTAAAVKTRTGTRPDDLGLNDDTELVALIEELLTEATDIMNRVMRRATDWNAEDDIPAGLNGIANDIVTSSLREMVQTRQTPIVRVDDFAVRTISARVLSKDVKDRLRLYSSKAIGTITVSPGDVADAVSTSLTSAELDAADLDAP